jgi:hypothetical protein
MDIKTYLTLNEGEKEKLSDYLANIYTDDNIIDWGNYNIENALNDANNTILMDTGKYLHGIQLLGARQYPGVPDIGVEPFVLITYKDDSGKFQYKAGVKDLIVFYLGRVGGRKSRLSRRSRKSLRNRRSQKSLRKRKRKNI